MEEQASPQITQSERSSKVPTGIQTNASASELNGPFPQELNRWSWAAFLMGWIWSIGMKNVIAFLLTFFLGFIGMIIVGIKGNEWAWKTRGFASVEEFKQIERSWTIWGIIVIVAGTIMSLIIMSIAGLAIFSALSLGASSYQNSDQPSIDYNQEVPAEINFDAI